MATAGMCMYSCNMHRICIPVNSHKMVHGPLVHHGETVTALQILGCELHENASGGRAMAFPSLPGLAVIEGRKEGEGRKGSGIGKEGTELGLGRDEKV